MPSRTRSGAAWVLAAVLTATAIVGIPSTPFAQQTPPAGSASASAATPPPAAPKPPGTMADAKAHMDKGQNLFMEKRFAEAAVEFHAAYEIKPFSTFLFNEAVCREKLKEWDEAIRLFQKYVDTDTSAPDKDKVLKRIEKLKAEKDKGAGGDAGVEPGSTASIDDIRSIVVIESLPEGAPVEIWQKNDSGAPKFVIGGANPGWTKIVSGVTLLQQSLPLGTYHVVIPKFQDYRPTETDITVAAATISQFKANLAQGAFYGVIKVRSFEAASEIRGAHVFVKKPGDSKFVDRGITPYEESLESGAYLVRVEQPGFVPNTKNIEVVHGRIDEQKFDLTRSENGLIRVECTNVDIAEVFVDDKPAGIWSPGGKVEIEVPNGLHVVKVKSEDKKTWKENVAVPKGKMVVVHVEPKPAVPRGTAWTTAIASAVFLGGGIYLGIQSNNLKGQLADAQAAGRLDQEDPRIKRGQYFAIGADIAFGVSGVLALISLYNFVRDPLPPSKGYTDSPKDLDAYPAAPRPATARIVPVVAPTVAGLSLVGEF